jgi:hypothetical protein
MAKFLHDVSPKSLTFIQKADDIFRKANPISERDMPSNFLEILMVVRSTAVNGFGGLEIKELNPAPATKKLLDSLLSDYTKTETPETDFYFEWDSELPLFQYADIE